MLPPVTLEARHSWSFGWFSAMAPPARNLNMHHLIITELRVIIKLLCTKYMR